MSKKRKNTPLVHWVWALTVLGLLAAGAGCGLGASHGMERADKHVFRYNESAAITSLDPAAARSLEHMWVVDQLYDGLVELNADLDVVPCVAKSWEVDPVTHTYTFHLRPGVAFASDVPSTHLTWSFLWSGCATPRSCRLGAGFWMRWFPRASVRWTTAPWPSS